MVALLLVLTALWIGTGGEHRVPALVTQDDSLPSALIAGHRLHLRSVGPPGAPTIIVLHGGPGGDFRSLTALAGLADTRRVVFYDQRGAGLSERVPAEALSLDGHLEELAEVIDLVSPDRRVTLIGHSWGAMLALAHVAGDPDGVDRLVLIEPGYIDAAGRENWQRASRRFLSGPRFLAAALANGLRAARVDGPDAHARKDFLIGRMVHAFASHPGNPYHCGQGYTAPLWRFGALSSETWEDAATSDIDLIGRGAESFDGPVLIMAGSCDTWLGADLQESHRGRFRDGQLVVVPNAGHDVIWDNPVEALGRIRTFLEPRGL